MLFVLPLQFLLRGIQLFLRLKNLVLDQETLLWSVFYHKEKYFGTGLFENLLIIGKEILFIFGFLLGLIALLYLIFVNDI
jgi:hypothetical protein